MKKRSPIHPIFLNWLFLNGYYIEKMCNIYFKPTIPTPRNTFWRWFKLFISSPYGLENYGLAKFSFSFFPFLQAKMAVLSLLPPSSTLINNATWKNRIVNMFRYKTLYLSHYRRSIQVMKVERNQTQ